MPLKKPLRASVMKLSTVSGASSTASSISIVPLSVSMKACGENCGEHERLPRRIVDRPPGGGGPDRVVGVGHALLAQQRRRADAHRPVAIVQRLLQQRPGRRRDRVR